MSAPAENGSPLPPFVAFLARATATGRRHPIRVFLGLPALLGCLVVGCLLPLANLPFILLALPSGVGSLFVVGLRLVDREPPVGRDWVGGFRFFERFFSLFWIGYLVLALCSWPILGALWLDRHVTSDGVRPWLLTTAAIASLLTAIALLHRYTLVFFVAAEAPRHWPVQQVLDRSAALFDPRPIQLGFRLLGLALFAASGAAARGFGLVLTLPLAFLATAHLYRYLAPRATNNDEVDLRELVEAPEPRPGGASAAQSRSR